ncbi:MAG: MobF family relaxase [Solirubrobacteraceae bacterium]|jgi:conjugative relaxase-like TrwC/TraI family protein
MYKVTRVSNLAHCEREAALAAEGPEAYYVRDSVLGVWRGNLAAELGLAGELQEGDLQRATEIAAGLREHPVKNLVFDCTFSVPKSISVMHFLADAETRELISTAIQDAIDVSVGKLEEEHCRVARGHARESYERSVGLLACAYTHLLSRAHDPQYHVHLCIVNIGRGLVDGRYTGLDARELFRTQKLIRNVFHAQLRANIHRTLGWEWGTVDKGMAELADGPHSGGLKSVSQRRESMKRAERELNDPRFSFRTASSADALALKTRPGKTPIRDVAAHRSEIEGRLARHGFDGRKRDELLRDSRNHRARQRRPGWTQKLSRHEEPPELGHASLDELCGPDGLTARQNTFTSEELEIALLASAQQGMSWDECKTLRAETFARPDVHETIDGDRTTGDLLACERRIIEASVSRKGEGAGRIDARDAIELLRRVDVDLDADQRAAVLQTVTSGDGVQIVEALAGSGKTSRFARAVAQVYTLAGYTVIGASEYGQAAQILQGEADVPSETLARRLNHVQRYGGTLGDGNTVLIIDEAPTAKTRGLDVILGHCRDQGIKVVSVGDSGQLSSVQAGGWMRPVKQRLGQTAALTNVYRQADRAEVRALASLHAGDPAKYLAWALKHDRIEIGEASTLVAKMLGEWKQAVADHGPRNVIVTCPDNALRHDINRECRAHLAEQDALGEQRTYGSRSFAVHDRVVCRHPDYKLDVRNGNQGAVVAVDRDHLAVRFDVDGVVRQLPTEYAAAHVEHAYCLTRHKGQGANVARAFAIGPERSWTKNHSYVALSRAKGVTRMFVTAPEDGQLPTVAGLTRNMVKRDDEDLAVDQVRPLDRDLKRGRGGLSLGR